MLKAGGGVVFSPLARRLFPMAAVGSQAESRQAASSSDIPIGVTFAEVARAAGLNHETIYGGGKKNKKPLGNTGRGVDLFYYLNEGRRGPVFV